MRKLEKLGGIAEIRGTKKEKKIKKKSKNQKSKKIQKTNKKTKKIIKGKEGILSKKRRGEKKREILTLIIFHLIFGVSDYMIIQFYQTV